MSIVLFNLISNNISIVSLSCRERRLFFTFTDFIGFITIGLLAIFAQVAFRTELHVYIWSILDFSAVLLKSTYIHIKLLLMHL